MALVQLSQHFKESLFKTVPNLWAHIHSPLTELPESPANVEEGVVGMGAVGKKKLSRVLANVMNWKLWGLWVQ